MSSLGPISYEGKDSNPWLAREFSEPRLSQTKASQIDDEVKKIVDSAYNKAKEILTLKRKILDAVTSSLLEKETIYEDEFKALAGIGA